MPPKKDKQIKYKDGYIFVDVSYLVFYRYFALKRWFSFAHKDIVVKDDKWLDNKEFIEKFEKTLLDTILKIAKKQKIQPSNIVFAFDCHHKDIWRIAVANSYYNSLKNIDVNVNTEYKGTRADAHEKQNFSEFAIFEMVKKKMLSPFIKKYNNIKLEHKNAEADDCIAIGIRHLREKKKDTAPIWIIASDTDYLQICDSTTHLIDLKQKVIDDKHLVEKKINNREYLLNKIMIGDVSDNIFAVKLNPDHFELLDDKYNIKIRKNKKEEYKITKSIAGKIMENSTLKKELLEFMERDLPISKEKLAEYNAHFAFMDLKHFAFNQTMIDFKYIPKNIVEKIYGDMK
jgi:5'-3' exonuclease